MSLRRLLVAVLALAVLPACGTARAHAVTRVPTPPARVSHLGAAAKTPSAPAPPPPSPGPFAPNEMGVVPILEFHRFGTTDGRWQVTFAEFARLLAGLYRHGFRPVDFRDVAARRIGLPKGYAPVVLTFDDGDPSQFRFAAGGRPAADSAVGMLWRFHRQHPGWALRGSFYVNRHPFQVQSAAKLRWLVAHGFEVGDHTLDHVGLDGRSAAYVLHEVGGLAAWVQSAVPGYRVATLAYPYGSGSRLPATTWRGAVGGQSYHLRAALLVGAGPAPSPYSRAWRPHAVPRIQVVNPRLVGASTRRWIWGGPQGWEARLLAHPGDLYVSDGNPHTVTIPSGQRSRLAAGLGVRVRVVDRRPAGEVHG